MVKLRICALFLVLFFSNLVFSAERCYKCDSSSDSECEIILNSEFPNQCQNTMGELNCLIYKYKVNSGETYIARSCTTSSDDCKNLETNLTKQHKGYIDCHLCNEDLCNKAFGSNGSHLVKMCTSLLLIIIFYHVKYQLHYFQM